MAVTGAAHYRVAGSAALLALPMIPSPCRRSSEGEILITDNVGPMWTPLFPLLGGLVLERGSVGQHAAATAREYGVPAAIQVKDACRHIVDGSWSTVDGESGVVTWTIQE